MKMHIVECKDEYGNIWIAKYSKDFHGPVFIHKHDINSEHSDMVLDFCIIKELAAVMILENKVSKLREQTTDQLLGFVDT